MKAALVYAFVCALAAFAAGGIALLAGASAHNARELTVWGLAIWPVCGLAGYRLGMLLL